MKVARPTTSKHQRVIIYGKVTSKSAQKSESIINHHS